MPITVHVPEGMFSDNSQATIVAGLTESILEVNGASKNPFVRKHLIVDVQTVPIGKQFADGKPTPYVNVTLRVPVFSTDTIEKQRAFTTAICDIIEREAAGKLTRERIYVNMINGDGFWGVEGHAYTNDELKEKAMKSQPAA
jgi:hypothetical protein